LIVDLGLRSIFRRRDILASLRARPLMQINTFWTGPSRW
jgi:hypothetical protein